MNTYIVDTNFFVNMEIKSGFGSTSKDVVQNFVEIARKNIQDGKAQFYISPRIHDELLSFFEGQPFFNQLLSVLTIKSPEIVDVQFNATVFYQLVDEMRDRSYKGLRVAEEAIEQGARKVLSLTDPSKQEYQQALQDPIKHLRERYRQATRFNFLDSVADLDLIVLTKETNGFLVSSDEGVIRWGRVFGIKEIPASTFKEELLSL